jgi:hypothetical protein
MEQLRISGSEPLGFVTVKLLPWSGRPWGNNPHSSTSDRHMTMTG